MKFLIVCTFTFYCCFNSFQLAVAQRSAKEEQIENDCMTKFKITSDQLAKLHARDFESINPDPTIMCYARCFFNQADIVNQDGVLNLKVIEQEAPNEIKKEMPSLVGRCSSLGGADSCETAFRQSKCLVNEMKVLEKTFTEKFLEEQNELMRSATTTDLDAQTTEQVDTITMTDSTPTNSTQ